MIALTIILHDEFENNMIEITTSLPHLPGANELTIKSTLNATLLQAQSSFCKCAQPMRDDVTMWHHLSLAGCIYKVIPTGSNLHAF